MRPAKGGNIKRITEALDPRGFEVHPIAKPTAARKVKALSVEILESSAENRTYSYI